MDKNEEFVSGLQNLRAEIVESEKARIDLLKYKLLVIATLGAVGLGLSDSSVHNSLLDAEYVLCIIPFACIYVDLLCQHNTLRILVIGSYLDHHGDPYETFLSILGRDTPHKNAGYFFELEDFALQWSTIAISLALLAYGIVILNTVVGHVYKGYILTSIGLVGVLIPLFLYTIYRDHVETLFNLKSGIMKCVEIVHNAELKKFLRSRYTLQDIGDIQTLLAERGTFQFPTISSGLYSAALLTDKAYTGYQSVWVRDNVLVAYAHYAVHKTQAATSTIRSLAEYFKKYRHRFVDILEGRVDPNDAMSRPHIKFNGMSLEELGEKWAHAQNDALGYFLWLYCLLANDKHITLQDDDLELMALFVLYFRRVEYWCDEDSGHWEEVRKISASSIGVVVAGLSELKKLLPKTPGNVAYKGETVTLELLEKLIEQGREALGNILPAECIQADPTKHRRYDGSLLFLIYPLNVLSAEMTNQILDDVVKNLKGKYGVRRYKGDSYWAPDYKEKLKAEDRTVDFSDSMESRDHLLPEEGQEAQWCIFDPILSVIFGRMYQLDRDNRHLAYQTHYLNRALGQITGEGGNWPEYRCPELYYMEKGEYVINDHVPLLWAQANLMIALKEMQDSLMM